VQRYKEKIADKRKEIDRISKEKVAILVDMEYSVHNLDVAADFVKLGGIQLIKSDLNSTLDELRASVAMTLGSAMQNNPDVQKAVLDINLLPTFLRLLATDSSLLVKQRALYALSCLVRNQPLAQKAFLSNGGFSTLSKLFGSKGTSLKLQVKAIAFATDLLAERREPTLVDKFEANDFCRHIVTLINSKDRDAIYGALDAASAVIRMDICGATVKQRIDDLKQQALKILKSDDMSESDLKIWLQELLGESDDARNEL